MTIAPAAPPSAAPRFRWWLLAAALLTVLKLSLVRAQSIHAIAPAIHDDKLFLQLAAHLINGDWLGPYTEMTLAKGPLYPIFIAANFYLGLPLLLTQQLVYAGACALVVRALRPWLPSGWARLTVYAVLLWNPFSYEGLSMTRLLRQHLSIPEAMVIAACLVALVLRRDESLRARLPWAATLGLALGGFWLTREESIWIVPMTLLMAAPLALAAWRGGAAGRKAGAWLAALALAGFALPNLTVSWLNYRHYGWFGTVEFRSMEFKAAYGALSRVQAGPDYPYVPVTHAAREAIYAVSPAFARLQPLLEGPVGDHWADLSRFPAGDRQIRSGWFVWAFRDAVRRAGLAPDARTALAYYRQVADEVNLACDEGRLPARGRRSGFAPVWNPAYLDALRTESVHFLDYALTFPDFSASPPFSLGTNEDVRLFRDLTHEQISPSLQAMHIVLPVREGLATKKLRWLGLIGRQVGTFCFWGLVAVQVAALLRALHLLWLRRFSLALWLAAAAWCGAVAQLGLNLLVHTMSFPNLTPAAYSPAYPLALLFMVLVAVDLTHAGRHLLLDAANPERSLAQRLSPLASEYRGLRVSLLLIAGLAAGGWFLSRPLPFEYDPAKRWPALLTPAGALTDLAYEFVRPAAEAYDPGRMVGAARLLPENLRNVFRGTHISGPADVCTVRSVRFKLEAPWLVVPFAGFPASPDNALRVSFEDETGRALGELPYLGANPVEVGFWAVDVRPFRGRYARIILQDGRADTEAWLAAGPPRLASSALTAGRLTAGWTATGQVRFRRLTATVALACLMGLLLEGGFWLWRRRK